MLPEVNKYHSNITKSGMLPEVNEWRVSELLGIVSNSRHFGITQIYGIFEKN